MNHNKQEFMEKFGFPGVIGVLDGTHVAILKPKAEAHNFYNRKGFYSLNTLLVCDANLKIISVNANYPGSNHDAFIWRYSAVRQFIQQDFLRNRRRTWLLGDSGFMLEPFLMIPFRNPVDGTPQARYNIAHMRARNCIERYIGVLKSRFRCLLKSRVSRYNENFVGTLINVCSTVHNICLRFNVPLLDDLIIVDMDNAQQIQINIGQNFLREGNVVRNNIVNQYFQ